MARKYRYETSRQALYEPATGAQFFEDWTPEDTANHDLLCAEMSRLAYARRDVVERSLSVAGFSLQQWIGSQAGRERLRARGTDGFVATSQDGLTVAAFRGTEANKPEDLIADLIVVPTAWPDGGQVHRGFSEAYSAERDQIRSALDRHHRGQLLITGHSLGAALATLAAADHRGKNPTLITFGSPRAGDEGFGGRLGGITCRRFVNCCDVVTRIPPESFATEPIRILLGDLTGAAGLSMVAGLAMGTAAVLSGPLRLLTKDAQFFHIGEALYADRKGAFRPSLAPTAIEDDQREARSSYPGGQRPDASDLFAHLKAGVTPDGDVERVRNALLAFAKGLLASDRVPLRDLADHAPINYVSIFTGRL